MTVERMILCGPVSHQGLPCQDQHPLILSVSGANPNVVVTIEDVRKAFYRELSEELLDLIDVAAYVYTTDQAIRRGNSTDKNFGEDWRRRLYFRIAVRCPELWNSPEVHRELVDTLSFLTEDVYHFEFEPLRKAPSSQQYFTFTEQAEEVGIDEVVMFSGGLDSLGGAIQESVRDHRRVLLVQHRSTPKMLRRHQDLTKQLQQRAPVAIPLHVPIRAHKASAMGREHTQRSRSFLYASLGAAIAIMIGRDRLRFYENGIVSFNLPPSAQVVGARATRTTHPRALNGFSSLITKIREKKFTVENPFRWHTKADVVREIAAADCGDLIGLSTSCASTRKMSNRKPHCGTCSQCIDRRFAVLAAEQQANDPTECYEVDLLTRNRAPGESRTMLACYLETALRIAQMSAGCFYSRYGEISRALCVVDELAETSALKLHRLYQKHAQEIERVVQTAIQANAHRLMAHDLPTNCLIHLVCDSGHTPLTVPSSGTTVPEGESLGPNVFRKCGAAWQVRFNNRNVFLLLPSKGTAYLHVLLSNPGKPQRAVDVALYVAEVPQEHLLGDAGPSSDEEALAVYRARYEDLTEELAQAKQNQDLATQQRCQEEMSDLLERINKDKGLGGRLRKEADDRERVRKAVYQAIRRAVNEIRKYDRHLAEHLSKPRLQCGRNPCYEPRDPTLAWET